MKTLLKDMKLCSVDLVPRGANPDTYICLYKSADITFNGIIHHEEISIHSPRVGVRPIRALCPYRRKGFQSTHPEWGETLTGV